MYLKFFLILSLGVFLNCFLAAPLKKESKHWQPKMNPKKVFKDWNDVFKSAKPIQITALKNGDVYTGPSVLIDKENSNTPEKEKIDQWVPAMSYLVSHPSEGYFLFDTGVPTADKDGRCDFSLYGFIYKTACKVEPATDIASLLSKLAIQNSDLNFAIISHLHGDHLGGVRDLLKRGNLNVLISEDEKKSASEAFRILHGYPMEPLSLNFNLLTLANADYVNMPKLGRVYDLFGDGSIWLIDASGHTNGELAALVVSSKGSFLFTFDSSHLKAGFENNVVPGFTVDKTKASNALSRMRNFVKEFPQVKVIYGHEPSQWSKDVIQPLTK
ncbi:MAG TPA: MBL fold metallo-hydrolase [Leptospiraceae bacterium]|nr:MBL fold metallo-hydrolase [Leptospiraceae bacterium]HMW04167.1 MBL fold metallo-hydrolase [Leptospiraceae bacterium]HMX34670.1 MBL fold metallo-hydrolase [Leptospiraceae bacterium]HMY30160.1 MBL fold metallo-hydrolase [Leptospiraceae bacterium]HMZ67215.1 MBL fold metallo-hydrolase [Leptospiraceae bacterium]